MKKKWYQVLTILFIVIMMIIIGREMLTKTIWFDELEWTINPIAQPSLLAMLDNLVRRVFNLPLYYLCLYPIYHLAPYGVSYLLIPNVIFTIIGVYLMKKIGNKIGGMDLGISCLLLATTSTILLARATLELRPYALLFLTSTFCLYCYINKLDHRNKKNIIGYTISLVLLSYTHWFGILMISFYFLLDLYFCIKKKDKLSFIYPYLITGIIFIPWLITMITTHLKTISNYYNWTKVPSIVELISTIDFLLSFNEINIILFILGICLCCATIFFKKNKYQHINVIISSIIFVLLTIFIYSKYLNPSYSLFIDRYFLIILPHILILTAIPLSEFLQLKTTKSKLKIRPLLKGIKYLIIILFVLMIVEQNASRVSYYEVAKIVNQDYEKAANLLIAQKGIYNQDNAVITSEGTGLLEYFFIKRNIPLPQNVTSNCYDNYTMSMIIKHGRWDEESKIVISDLLQFNYLYVFEKNNKLNKKLLDFIQNHYRQIVKEKEGISIYQRKKQLQDDIT